MRIHAFHDRIGRPDAHRVKQHFQVCPVPFGDELNRAIGQVTDPAADADIDGAALREPAEIDALDKAADMDVETRHFVRITFERHERIIA